MAVTVLALVRALQVAQEGRGAVARDGTFVEAAQSGRVVSARLNGHTSDIMAGCHDSRLRQHACLLEITVGDITIRVVPADESGLHFFWKRAAPHPSLVIQVKEHSTHSRLGRVGGS